MRKIREVLRLADECGRSQRQIASSLSVAVGTIHGHVKRAREAGLRWNAVRDTTDSRVRSTDCSSVRTNCNPRVGVSIAPPDAHKLSLTSARISNERSRAA